jgi:hypothetical protein
MASATKLARLRETAQKLARDDTRRVNGVQLRTFVTDVLALITEMEQAQQHASEAKINRRASQLGISPGTSTTAESVQRFEKAKRTLELHGIRVRGPSSSKYFTLFGGDYDGVSRTVWGVIDAGEQLTHDPPQRG